MLNRVLICYQKGGGQDNQGLSHNGAPTCFRTSFVWKLDGGIEAVLASSSLILPNGSDSVQRSGWSRHPGSQEPGVTSVENDTSGSRNGIFSGLLSASKSNVDISTLLTPGLSLVW